ncbi:MAG: glycosyltransferase family 4 protein [Bacteroidales bacterium]|nr:glycosyltransferase family 4 protein [Bacteroidales bacterium]
MRILQFITSLRPGGAERLVTDLALCFREAGNDVSLLLLDGSQTPFLEELERAGIQVTALSKGYRSMRNPFLIFKLTRFLKDGRFDIIHTHNTSCQYLAAVASLFLTLRMVTTEHNTSNRRRGWSLFKPLDRWMYSRYKRVFCVGEETLARLSEYVGPSLDGKSVLVRNGINIKKFTDAVPDSEISSAPGYKVIMVAAFRAQKDQATLIRSMALLTEDYHLFLVGGVDLPEDEPNLKKCLALTESLGLVDKVTFLGKKANVPSLLAAADAVVLSTHYEGMSLSVIEGMASGKPFVASDVMGVREQVKDAGVLFQESDEAALANVLKTLRDNPGYALEVSAKCREVATKYDIGGAVRRHLSEYQSIMAD